MTDEKTFHVLMRFSDKLSPVETIPAHQEVIATMGAVWLAKAGKPMAQSKIDAINRQAEQGVETTLYLVQRVANDYELYRGTIISAARRLPKAESNLVPAYYADSHLLANAELWIKLSALQQAPSGEIDNLVLLNTASRARESLRLSTAALFFVRRPSTERRATLNSLRQI